jgi:hypothetical protein
METAYVLEIGWVQGRDKKGTRRHGKRATESMLLVTKVWKEILDEMRRTCS